MTVTANAHKDNELNYTRFFVFVFAICRFVLLCWLNT